MLHSFKRYGLVFLMLLAGAQSMFGFSLLGPLSVDTWQNQANGYFLPGDLGGPKNLGEGYRWNTRTLYYAYDANFLDYFGSNGVAAVDQAFAVFNSLSNFSAYSSDLSEWPLTTTRINYRAQGLDLMDLKSTTMNFLMEQLGLAPPDRYVWTLHGEASTGPCPAFLYYIIQRNFDPVTYEYSSYVNGVFYDYEVQEYCGLNPNPNAPIVHLAVPFPVDPSQEGSIETAVANNNAGLGVFYTGLTRDDIGGLRYLYGTNRINEESATATAQQIFTNTSNEQLLVTSNLNLFLEQSLTNTPAALEALYPGLIVSSSTNFFTNQVTTNISATFVQQPNAPAGTFVVQFITNYTTNVVQLFADTFANVVTNHYYTNGFITTAFTNVVSVPNAPAGTVATNVVTSTVIASFPNGDFYIIPSNALCSSSGFQIIATDLVSVVAFTNILGTNATGATGITNGQSTTFEVITYSTNYTYTVFPIQCLSGSNNVTLLEGLDKINFVRRDFDSLLGNTWNPVTNYYTLTAVTNGATLVQSYQRVVTQPDILISAQDLVFVPVINTYSRSIDFNSANTPTNLAGPGNIEPPVLFQFNKVGPIYLNSGPFFIDPVGAIYLQTFSSLFFQWGSFDGTTNDPVVYPSGASLAALESQVFFQVTTGLIPDASVSTNNAGNPYQFQLQASGASPPYTWSLATGSPALPTGLNLSANGVISGSPTTTGIYDFTVQATDIGARTTQKSLFIQIDP
jgi:hypothetical protein